MPRRIPTASQWQPTDILGQYHRLAAPFVRSLARCLRLHFQGEDPDRVRQAFEDARGAIVFLRVAIRYDAERPRQATVNRNLDTLAEALSDALAALSALDIRAREALYEAASTSLSTTRQGLNLTPFKDEVVEIVDIDGVPTRISSNTKRLRGRHAVRQFAAACSDAAAGLWPAAGGRRRAPRRGGRAAPNARGCSMSDARISEVAEMLLARAMEYGDYLITPP